MEYSPCGGSVSNGYHVFFPETRGWLQAMAVNARDPVEWTYWAGGPITAGGATSDRHQGSALWNRSTRRPSTTTFTA